MPHSKWLDMYRIALFLWCVLSVTSLQAQNEKTITAEFKDTPLSSALKRIEKMSSYKILFTYDDVQAYKVTATLKDVTVKEALKKILEGKPFTFSDVTNGKYISVVYQPQQKTTATKTIQGSVRDEHDDPLIGATLRVVNSATGTITNANGDFTMRIPEAITTIEVAFIGMKTQLVSVKNKTELHIVLESDNTLLTDVVVTGYQTLSKERSAGSFDVVQGVSIKNKAQLSGSVLEGLEGLTTGLNISHSEGSDKFLIRGVTSINSTRTPLFVVDGVPLEESLVEEMVNSSDIASISVLKDATAASIWGSQAANGVVVITTTKGTRNQKLKVSYDGSFTWIGMPDYDYLDLMDGKTFMKNALEMFEEYSRQYDYNTVKTTAQGISSGSTYTYNPIVFPHEIAMYRYLNQEITLKQRDAELARLIALDGRKSYEDNFMSNKLFTKHSLNFQGGGDKHTYYISLGYLGEQGNYQEWNDRFSINSRQDLQLTPWLKWDVTLNATYGNKKGKIQPWHESGDPFYSSYSNYRDLPYATFRDENGQAIDHSIYQVYADKRTEIETLSKIDMSFYPIEDFKRSSDKTLNTNLRANTGLTVDLIKGLKYEGRFQYSRIHSRNERYQPSENWLIREERLNAMPQNTLTTLVPVSGGHFNVTNRVTNDWTVRNQLSFDRDFDNGRHQIIALAGTEIRSYLSTGYTSFLRGYDMQTMQYSPYDVYQLSQPVMGAIYGSSYNTFRTSYYNQTETSKRYFSLYANAAYTYDYRYTLNASVRMDQSNLFGSDPSTQYKPIWSVGAAWKLSEENFMSSAEMVDDMSLRVSFGLAGNSPEPGQGGKFDILSATSNFNFETPGYNISTPSNDKITWEQTRTINAGIDLRLFSSRLSLSIDWYDKKTTDLLGVMMLNPTTGWISTTGNLGTMTNKGFELSLSSINIRGKDFNWYTNFTLSYNKNKITRLTVETPYTAQSLVSSGNYVEGYAAASLFAYRWAGLDGEGKPQTYDRNGNLISASESYALSTEDVRYMGTTVPKFYGGLTNRLTYKAWELSFMFVYNLGHKMRNDVAHQSHGRPASNMHKDVDKRWRKPGDEVFTDVPAYTVIADNSSNYQLYYCSDKNVLDASYIKLRDLSLAWNLPHRVCRKVAADNIRINLQVGNLFYWAANNEGIDPEAHQLGWYSQSRQDKFGPTYSVGLTVNFK